MSRLGELVDNFRYVQQEEGPFAVADRLGFHAGNALRSLRPKSDSHDGMNDFVDVLFVNGCDFSVPHPIRYRVDHQAEQLEDVGISTKTVNAWELTEDHARLARAFVIFRCPYTSEIGAFIELVHSLNKVVLFDIDDLVVDTSYTDQIPYLDTMTVEERAGYDEGVRAMGRTMMLCDGVITTTDQLACELGKKMDTVFVNRNVASEEMLYFSQRAVFERDVLPRLPKSEVKAKDRHRWMLSKERAQKREGVFRIGYFSGSITHNDDFRMILPAVLRFMTDYSDVTLHVVGDLDLPSELEFFSDRVVREPFSPWRHLPKMLSFVDVNLIPLVDTLFNRAKSENKWIEAGLVKVASVASKVGALADAITDGVDGLLCTTPDEWYAALVSLREDSELRQRIASNAHAECTSHHVTCGTGAPFSSFIRSQMHPNLGFVLPSLNVSGGVLVAIKHAEIMAGRGVDVTLVSNDYHKDSKWVQSGNVRLPVVSRDAYGMRGRFDKLVATMWSTLQFVKDYVSRDRCFYLVQGLETGFYEAGDPLRADASKTYGFNPEVTYCTISPWCKSWLERDFGHVVRYAPNGIDCGLFMPCDRDWSEKIRILIEGDSSSEYKNVDESFAIIDKLDPKRYEIWYLSYKGDPKLNYRVDKFFKKVPHEEVVNIYRQCHILLKTSVLESFSYPPLEMMATGGIAVVLSNEGNAAYLVDGKNCLLFDQGEDDKAASLVEQVVADDALRARLCEGGLRTARRLSWDNLTDQIAALYD